MFGSIQPKLKAFMALGVVLPALIAASSSPTATASAAGRTGQGPKVNNHFTSLKATLHEGTIADSLRIQGDNLPPRGGVRLALLFSDGHMANLKSAKVGSDGTLDITRAVAEYPAGTTFKVVAFGGGGFKGVSGVLTVVR